MSTFPSGPEFKKYFYEIHFSIIFSFFCVFLQNVVTLFVPTLYVPKLVQLLSLNKF